LGIFDRAIAETAAPEAFHPFVDMDRLQLRKHHPANQRNDVLLDAVPVIPPCAQRNAALGFIELQMRALQTVSLGV
jgi:hypothetical protein